MTVARYFVFLVIIIPCYVESGSLWLIAQPPSALLCDPRRPFKSHVRLECAVAGPEGSTLRIKWYHWDDQLRVTSGKGEFVGRGKQLLKSNRRAIGAKGRFSSTLSLSGVGLSGCYACQADSTKPQHLTAASNVLCFEKSDYNGFPPCNGTLLVDGAQAVELKRSRHVEKAGSLAGPLFHSFLRKDASELNDTTPSVVEGASGRQDRLTAVYAGIGVCVVFVISILLLMAVISGLCWRRHARRKMSTPSTAVTITATNGTSLESSTSSSASPLRMSAFSRTQSDGDLANLRIPRFNSNADVRRHRRCSEADSRDEALRRSDRSRSPYRIPLTIMPGPLTCPGVEYVDGEDPRDESGPTYACAGPSEEDDNVVRAKPNAVCHRRSYSEVIILPQRVPSADLFDDPKYASVCIASAAAGVTSPLPPSQLNN